MQALSCQKEVKLGSSSSLPTLSVALSAVEVYFKLWSLSAVEVHTPNFLLTSDTQFYVLPSHYCQTASLPDTRHWASFRETI